MRLNGRIILAAGMVALSVAAVAEEEFAYPPSPERIGNETAAEKAARLKWWTDARFGMFVHFGVYALPARHEWVKSNEHIPDEVYDSKYVPRFNPDLFDAREWARQAKAAGMKYVVLTTKHHDGFCMWDTKTTDYKVTKTPFGRDLVREYVDACRAEGLRVGFYFSVIDWHHPDFTIDQTHPRRPHEITGPDGKPKLAFTPEIYARLNEGRDMARYRAYMFAQVRELLTDYGRIDVLWFDYTSKGRYGKTWKDWDAVELLKLARKLQPGVLVDNRLGLDNTVDGGDFVTPEQFKVTAWPKRNGERWPWETCQTFSGSWGYHRDEMTWKDPAQLIELLIHTVSFGGNLILNVGPTGRGAFDCRATERLEAIGRWMKVNGRSIYGCTQAPEEFKAPEGTLLTYNPEQRLLYVHLLDYPLQTLSIAFGDRVAYAQLLHDASELEIVPARTTQGQSGEMEIPAQIRLPVAKPPVLIPVIELYLR